MNQHAGNYLSTEGNIIRSSGAKYRTDRISSGRQINRTTSQEPHFGGQQRSHENNTLHEDLILKKKYKDLKQKLNESLLRLVVIGADNERLNNRLNQLSNPENLQTDKLEEISRLEQILAEKEREIILLHEGVEFSHDNSEIEEYRLRISILGNENQRLQQVHKDKMREVSKYQRENSELKVLLSQRTANKHREEELERKLELISKELDEMQSKANRTMEEGINNQEMADAYKRNLERVKKEAENSKIECSGLREKITLLQEMIGSKEKEISAHLSTSEALKSQLKEQSLQLSRMQDLARENQQLHSMIGEEKKGIEGYQVEFDNLRNSLENAKQTIHDLEIEREKLQDEANTEIDRINSELNQAFDKLEESERIRLNLERQIKARSGDQDTRIEHYENEMARITEYLNQSEDEKSRILSDKKRLEELVQEMKKDIRKMGKKIELERIENQARLKQLESNSSKIGETERKRIEQEICALYEDEREKTSAAIDSLQNDLLEARKRLERERSENEKHIQQIQDKMKDIESEKEKSIKEAKKFKDECLRIEEAFKSMEEEIQNLDGSHDDVKKENDSLKSTLRMKEGRIRDLESQINLTEQEVKNLNNQIEGQQKLLQAIEERCLELEKKREELITGHSNLSTQVISLKRETEKTQDFEREISNIRIELSQQIDVNSEYKVKLASKDRELINMKGELERSIKENEALQSDLQEIISEAKSEQSRTKDLELQLKNVKDENENLENSLVKHKTEIRNISDQLGERDESIKKLQDMLKNAEIIKSHSSQLETERQELHHRIRDKAQQIDDLEDLLTTRDSQIKSLESDLSRLHSELSKIESQLSVIPDLEERFIRVKTENSSLQNEILLLKDSLKQANEHLDEKQGDSARVSELELHIKELNSNIATLSKKLEITTSDAETWRQKYSASDQQLLTQAEKLDYFRHESEQLSNKLNEREARIEALESQVSSLRKTIDKVSLETREALREKSSLEETLRDTENRLERAYKETENMKVEIQELTEDFNNNKAQFNQESKAKEILDLQKRLQLLEDENQQLYNEKNMVLRRLKDSDDHRSRFNKEIQTLEDEVKQMKDERDALALKVHRSSVPSNDYIPLEEHKKIREQLVNRVVELEKIVKSNNPSTNLEGELAQSKMRMKEMFNDLSMLTAHCNMLEGTRDDQKQKLKKQTMVIEELSSTIEKLESEIVKLSNNHSSNGGNYEQEYLKARNKAEVAVKEAEQFRLKYNEAQRQLQQFLDDRTMKLGCNSNLQERIDEKSVMKLQMKLFFALSEMDRLAGLLEKSN